MSPACTCGRGSDLTLVSETREEIGPDTIEKRRKYHCDNCGGSGIVLDVDGGETRHTGCLKIGGGR